MSVFSFDEQTGNVSLLEHPAVSGLASTATQLIELIGQSEYCECDIIASNIGKLFAQTNTEAAPSLVIAKAINAQLTINIDEKNMLVEASLVTAKGGKLLNMEQAIEVLTQAGVKKGISSHALEQLLAQQFEQPSGSLHTAEVAFGKTPKVGNDAKFVRLCCTAQDRILSPQAKGGGKVDMRNLGDIITVKPGNELMRRIPATLGVDGFTVFGDVLTANPGKEHKLQPFDGTKIAPDNSNLLIADCTGVPVALSRGMRVDDVLCFHNIDPSTGHVEFDGSIIVSGDIKDGMRVTATGDITVLGFVESAQLKSDSAITIGKGAIGRKREADDPFTCSIFAKRTIAIGYTQYCDIKTQQNLLIERQSLHCNLSAGNLIRVGKASDSKGKIIGGHILDAMRIETGELGAPAGTKTRVCIAQRWYELKQKQAQITDFEKVLISKSIELQQARERINKRVGCSEHQQFLNKIKINEEHLAKRSASISQQKQLIRKKMAQLLALSHLKVNELMHPGVELKIARESISFSRNYPAHLITHSEGKITQSF
ncbi:FapA family protein [Pseudoalteromonas sp.]|uniref:DUF342 domain-containing protein n=1 Tax=Pseudoalteromonas sp. TaxID=53249 RepID=UPI001BD17E96|nr:FapA family protein [Pseudoalteromonas sp.]